MSQTIIDVSKRICGTCTKCCEGWLTANIHGHEMYPGRPCHFLSKNCSIYEKRPNDPCKTFICEWRRDDSIPEWMKPDEANVIIAKMQLADESIYYRISEAGGVMPANVLNWLVHWALNNQYNIIYSINGGSNRVGATEFIKADLSKAKLLGEVVLENES